MEISPLILSVLLFYSSVWGITVGVLNDVNKLIRFFIFGSSKEESSIKKENGYFSKKVCNAIIFFQDTLCIVVASIGIILLNYYYSDGHFRFFSFLSMVIGFFIYYFALSEGVMFIFKPLILFFRRSIVFLIKLIIRPFFIIFSALNKKIKKIFLELLKHIEKGKNLRYNKNRKEYLLKMSQKGFLQ